MGYISLYHTHTHHFRLIKHTNNNFILFVALVMIDQYEGAIMEKSANLKLTNVNFILN